MSEFWKYFKDVLRWPQIHEPGALQVPAKGLALTLDTVRDDIVYLRDQFLPKHCDDLLIAEHGKSRSLTRYYKESSEQFRSRVINAYAWHMLGGKTLGLPQILKFYGFDIVRLENISKYQPSRWAEFQIGLASFNSATNQNTMLENLETLIWLINEYKPARSILSRIYNDEYNRIPTVWSEAPAWSEGFWSHFSGVTVPSLDDDKLIVSFGMPYRLQCDQYTAGGVGIAREAIHAALCPYVDRPIWSRSSWSEIYLNNTSFTVGELLSIHWCVNILQSDLWHGAWDKNKWFISNTWDRILPNWQIISKEKAKSQAIFSEQGHDNCILGDINSNYSLPTYTILDAPPKWGDFAYSDDACRIKTIEILEQYHKIHAVSTEHCNTNDEIVGTELALVDARAFIIPYIDRPIWGLSSWSDVFPRTQIFFNHCVSCYQFAAPVLENQKWNGSWDSHCWAKVIGYDRPLPSWDMSHTRAAKAQAIFSDASGDASGTYGDINSTYGIPTVNIESQPPKWGEFAYSEDGSRIQRIEILERFHEVYICLIEAVKADDELSCGTFVNKSERAFILPYIDRHIWGLSAWSDVFPRSQVFFSHCVASYQFGQPVLQQQEWNGNWDKRRWAEVTHYDRTLSAWNMHIKSESR